MIMIKKMYVCFKQQSVYLDLHMNVALNKMKVFFNSLLNAYNYFNLLPPCRDTDLLLLLLLLLNVFGDATYVDV